MTQNIDINKLTPVTGFDGYFCNQSGKLFSYKKRNPIEIVGTPDKDGYLKVVLYKSVNNPVNFRLHRVIAMTFLGKSNQEVNHINGNKQDNHIDNLEYVSLRENQSHRRQKEGCFVGVCWAKKEKKWRAYIQVDKVWEHLGFYTHKEKAKEAYNNRLHQLKIQNKYA